MTLQIIGIPQSSFVRVVRMAAHEKGVDYELVPAMPHTDEVMAIHPLGKVPVMRHGDVELAESEAIVRYIDREFDGPALFPDDAAKADLVGQWISIVTTAIDLTMIRRYVLEYFFNKDEDGNVVRDTIDDSVDKFPALFEVLNGAVKDGYFGSDRFTAADCFIAPILFYVSMFPEGKEHLEKQDALNAYYGRLSERESFKATTPPPPSS